MKGVNPPSFQTPSSSEDGLSGSVSGGSNAFMLLLGDALDLLSRYRLAFLALGAFLSRLLAVGILGDLVILGLAVGLFGVIVDLTSQYLKSGSSSKVKKTSKTKKGG